MINLLAVAFEPPPWLKASAAHQALAVFEREHWSPPHAALRMIVAPCQWWGAADAIELAARGMDRILLLGSQSGDMQISVTARAINRASPKRRDASGQSWPGSVLAPGGLASFESQLDAAALAHAFSAGEVRAAVRAPDDYIYNAAFYALLRRNPRTSIALAHLPLSIESARAERKFAIYNRMQLIESVRGALCWMAASARAQRDVDLACAS